MSETIKVLTRILTDILTAFYQPLGFSVLFSVFALFFYLYAYDASNAGKGWKIASLTWIRNFKESIFFRKLYFLVLITIMILFRTLLNRNLWLNPLSNIMGGWWIWETLEDGTKNLTTECIENIVLFVPFTGMLMWTMKEKIVKRERFKDIVWKSTEIAFCFSIGIEFLQLIMRLGTFQFADIFYNTIGGMVGGMFYWIGWKLKNKWHTIFKRRL